MNQDNIIEYLESDTIGYCDGCDKDVKEKLYTEDGYEYFCLECWNEKQERVKDEKM